MIFGKGQSKKSDSSTGALTGEFTFGSSMNNINEDVRIIDGGEKSAEKVVDWPDPREVAGRDVKHPDKNQDPTLVYNSSSPNGTNIPGSNTTGSNKPENVPSSFAQTYGKMPGESPLDSNKDNWKDSYQKSSQNSKMVEQNTKKVSIAAGTPDNIEEEMRRRFGSEICSALGKGTIIEGSFCFDTPVCIDGTITGEIKASSVLIVGKNAVVKAKIEVGSLIVCGSVTGDIKADDLIEVKSTGILDGNLVAKRFVIEDGGWFKGNCKPTKERLDDDYLE